MKPKIAAVVVLYQPNHSILKNINSYITAVDRIFVVDNSINTNDKLVVKIESLSPKITYIGNNANMGVGHALNTGAQHAINDRYRWLLTMDQDSRFEDIGIFFSCIKKHNINTNIAIFAPCIDAHPSSKDLAPQNPKIVITSGNLINLEYYQLVNGFESKLFIDEIDHDYCLKLGEHKLKIMQFPHITLHHAIGEETQLTSILFRRKKFRKIHDYQRIYYQTRNRLYMSKRHYKNYPEAFSLGSVLYKVIYKKGIRILQWEPDKLRKLKAIYHGVSDYLNDNYGIYDANNRH